MCVCVCDLSVSVRGLARACEVAWACAFLPAASLRSASLLCGLPFNGAIALLIKQILSNPAMRSVKMLDIHTCMQRGNMLRAF